MQNNTSNQHISTSAHRHIAIIVAGGSGTRFSSITPKQFMLLAGKPVLMHTISNFSEVDKIILVLPAEHIPLWKELCSQYAFTVDHQIVAGGSTRFDSVKNGLTIIASEAKQSPGSIIGIHDGVRPLTSSTLINKCFEEAEQHGSAIPCVPVNESLRKTGQGRSFAVDRTEYVLVQTPQCFSAKLLLDAYAHTSQSSFTDDATVVEARGNNVHLIDGEKQNIKITYPEDLVFAQAYLSSRFSN